MFLNALFEADCVTSDGQPKLSVYLTGDTHVPVATPQGAYTIRFDNAGLGTALDGELRVDLPAGVSVVDAGGGVASGSSVVFSVGGIGPQGSTAPPSGLSRSLQLEFAGEGAYTLSGQLGYRVGATTLVAGPVTLGVGVGVEPPLPDGGAGDAGAGDSGASSGGADGAEDSGGCGCRTSPDRGSMGWLFVLAGAGAWLQRRRPSRSAARRPFRR